MAQVIDQYRSFDEDLSCDCIRRMVVEVQYFGVGVIRNLGTSNQRYTLAFHMLHRTFGNCDSWVASSVVDFVVIGHIVKGHRVVDSIYLSSS